MFRKEIGNKCHMNARHGFQHTKSEAEERGKHCGEERNKPQGFEVGNWGAEARWGAERELFITGHGVFCPLYCLSLRRQREGARWAFVICSQGFSRLTLRLSHLEPVCTNYWGTGALTRQYKPHSAASLKRTPSLRHRGMLSKGFHRYPTETEIKPNFSWFQTESSFSVVFKWGRLKHNFKRNVKGLISFLFLYMCV